MVESSGRKAYPDATRTLDVLFGWMREMSGYHGLQKYESEIMSISFDN